LSIVAWRQSSWLVFIDQQATQFVNAELVEVGWQRHGRHDADRRTI